MGENTHLVEDCSVGAEEVKLGEHSISNGGANVVELAVRLSRKVQEWKRSEREPPGPRSSPQQAGHRRQTRSQEEMKTQGSRRLAAQVPGFRLLQRR